MSVKSVVVNTVDLERAVAFYREFLRAEPVGEVNDDGVELDLVTATLRLQRVDGQGTSSTWQSEDLQRGFRHVGLKVDRLDPYVERLKAAGVVFHRDPVDATGGVRITFFYDPDGTLLELVEGHLEYTEVLDEEGVAAERALGVPTRPRFDHVALTVADLDATTGRYRTFGFRPVGTIARPDDPRGFHIMFLHSPEPTVLEVFTYGVDTYPREPQVGVPGFQAVVLDGGTELPGGFTQLGNAVDSTSLGVDGMTLYVDDDGLMVGVAS